MNPDRQVMRRGDNAVRSSRIDTRWSAMKLAAGRTAVPFARVCLRLVPWAGLKRTIWPRVSWREHEYVTRTRAGIRMSGNTADLVQSYIYYFGVWEPQLTEFVISRLSGTEGRTFVDVGANVGYFSLTAAKVMPGGLVVAIEAYPPIFEHLCRNVALNGYRNVRTVPTAALDQAGQVAMFWGGSRNEGATTTVAGRHSVEARPVPAMRLVDILSTEEWTKAKVIKIDVEGAEGKVVRGMTSRLGELAADAEVAIEVSPATAVEVFETFLLAGFLPYEVPNSYDVEEYLLETQRPGFARMHAPPTYQTDVVFSRVAAARLSY